jgi:methyl-accepting chemotaxis protein
VHILNRLSLSRKLLVLMIAMLLPAAILSYQYISDVSHEVSYSERELAGARYLSGVSNVLNPISRHRGQTGAYLNGETSFRASALASQAEADTAVRALDALDARYGELIGVQGQWPAVKAEWLALKDRALTLPTATEAYAQHSAVMDKLNDLINVVTTRTGIDLDPEPTTYYLQNVAFNLSFRALSDVVALRGRATTASSQGALKPEEIEGLLALKDNIPDHVQRLNAELQKAWAVSTAAKSATQPAAVKVAADLESFAALVYERLANANASQKVSAHEAFESGDNAANAVLELQGAVVSEFLSELQDRTSALERKRLITWIVGFAVLIMTAGLGLLITRAVTRPMKRAIATFSAISEGKYDNVIDHSGTDEAAQVLQALDQMQRKLGRQIETERAAAATNARIKQALDSVSSNVMVADEKLNVIYVNRAGERLFKAYESNLKRDLPRLDGSSRACRRA